VDSDADNYRKKIIAFVGGLDFCGRRYDTNYSMAKQLDSRSVEKLEAPRFFVGC
jgi:phospholipase D1/2